MYNIINILYAKKFFILFLKNPLLINNKYYIITQTKETTDKICKEEARDGKAFKGLLDRNFQ